ncbi:nuclear transport factor 2 family protein [Hymenobacter defluvii]|uniref:Nuclear transport factor 2 family protein n=1 Tax=Hymenobacter defluvii TaxID=2054411 RepID=A0ABS3TFF2_9BACT|nr:nuclear transport factor 2 family protein [Hymenobacter defluvii]MBO3272364.1 nuclear transport factor 2 family protein [Hymenobacter defluvii]
MKTLFLTLTLLCTGLQLTQAQAKLPVAAPTSTTKEEQEVLALSKTKWTWMADKNVAALTGLFKDNCVFVHMGGSWGKDQELSVIKGGMIWYKKAEVYAASVNMFGNTAILLNDIDLMAVVGGKEVINPFMVTEVYLKEEGKWKLGSLTFSHLARPVKLNAPASASPPQR